MRLSAIRTGVQRVIDDAGYSADNVDTYINLAIKRAADLVTIPELKKIDTVSTTDGEAYCSLTSLTGGFSGRLFRVMNSDGKIIQTMYNDVTLMFDEYGNLTEEGTIEAVCLEGTTLWYYKIPATVEDLTVLYLAYPTPLTEDTHEPSNFPEELHHPLFINGGAFHFFDEIEDGKEDEKINTRAMEWRAWDAKNPLSGLSQLRLWLARNRINHISSLWGD